MTSLAVDSSTSPYATGSLAAQDKAESESGAARLVREWLSAGEHKDFQWRVRVSRPFLTFQQRNLVWIAAEIPMKSLQKRSARRDLHFIAKIADESGRWLEGMSYTHHQVQEEFTKKVDLQLSLGFYLQPGTYRIAIIAYDAVLGERNVSFTGVKVKPPSKNFPQLLAGLPPVEFLSASVEGVRPLAHGHVSLQIPTERPVELDLVVDLSPYNRGLGRRTMGGRDPRLLVPRLSKSFQSTLIEAASVLTDMNLKNGCMRVTALDTLDRRIIVPPQTSTTVDWQKTWNEVVNTNLNLVSLDDLEHRLEAAEFVKGQLEQLMLQEPRCETPFARPLRIFAVLSQGTHFPYGTVQPKIQAKCDCKVFYLRQFEFFANTSDELKGMMNPLGPKRLDFTNSMEFRGKLFDFVQTIEKLSAD